MPDGTIQYSFPGIALVGVVIGFAAVIALIFRPHWAKYVAPVYAVGQGFAVGAISAYYDDSSTASSSRRSGRRSACSP